jgi:hypothetical protein
MAWTATTPELGIQPIQVSSATKNHDIGTIVTARDPVYGGGEFIYLLGVASTIAGSVVTYNGNTTGTPTGQTTLAPATANLGQPLAVAMSANLAASWGWYQIAGNAVAATNGTLATGPGKLYLAGSGQLTSTQGNGLEVLNAVNVTATGTPAANQAVVEINRPFAQGQAV